MPGTSFLAFGDKAMSVPFPQILSYMASIASNNSPEGNKLSHDITVWGTYVVNLTPDQQTQFWNAVGSFPALTKLKLQSFRGFDNTSMPLQASALASVLQRKQRSMEEEQLQLQLDNSGNSSIQRNKGIEEIIFASVQLMGDLQELSSALQSHTSLRMAQTWDIEDGGYLDTVLRHEVCSKDQMLELLVNIKQLKQLVLGNLQATRERMDIIAHALSQKDNHIKALRIRGCFPGPAPTPANPGGQKLDPATCLALANMLKTNQSLERLVLNHFDIADAPIPRPQVTSNTNTNNAADAANARKLAKEQEKANTGLVTILKGLEENKTLKSFQVLFGNYKMKPADLDALVNLLMKHNHVLQTFNARDRGGSSRHGKPIQRELAQTQIIDFYMAMNRDGLRNEFFGDAGNLDLTAFFELVASQSRCEDVERVTPKRTRKLAISEIEERNRYQLSCLFHLLRENAHVFVLI